MTAILPCAFTAPRCYFQFLDDFLCPYRKKNQGAHCPQLVKQIRSLPPIQNPHSKGGVKFCKTEFRIPWALLGTWYATEIPKPFAPLWNRKRDLNRTHKNIFFVLSVSNWCSLPCYLNFLTDLSLLSFIPLSQKLFGQLAVSCHLWSFFLKLENVRDLEILMHSSFSSLLVQTAFLRLVSHSDPFAL